MDTQPLAALDDLEQYRRLFTDVALWTPYVRAICGRHGLAPCERVRVGIPGTCPAFIVEDRWVVKFFGRLFDGAASYAVEQAAGRMALSDPRIPTANLRGWGALGGEGWPWPYLVFDYIYSISVGEVWPELDAGEKARIAREMGETVRALHRLPLPPGGPFPTSHEPYAQFLAEQRAGCAERHRAWGTLPAHLIDQIDAYLPPTDYLIDRSRPPHLIHADLTGDHLLGRLREGRWQTLALIDFGDARTGDFLYELAALHLDLFRGEKAPLGAFLESYGLPAHPEFPRRVLATCLLHQFNVFWLLPANLLQQPTLDALARALFEI